MRLKLKNFRCYVEKEYDFGLEGLLLISGSSGAGKTSLLMAINFALYGTGSKVVTYGKTSCSVELEIDNLSIIRTKKPNRLVLKNTMTDEEHEDDSAQSIINHKFGVSFDVTSYVHQNATNSFIMMSPTEKLEFLEKFAFCGIDLTKIKARCQATIKKRNEELIASTSQLEMASEHFKSLSKPNKIPFPLKTKNKEKSMKNELIKSKNNKILLKRVENRVFSLRKEYNDLKILEIKTETKTNINKNLLEKIDELLLEESSICYEGDEKLKNYEDQFSVFLSVRELTTLQKRLSEDEKKLFLMQETEQQAIKSEIDNINLHLWKEYSPDEISVSIIEYQQLLKDSQQLSRLNNIKIKILCDEEKLVQTTILLKTKQNKLIQCKEILDKLQQQKKLYHCPSCKAVLKLDNNKLFLYDEKQILSENIHDLQIEIKDLSCEIVSLENIVTDEQNKLQKYKEIEAEINLIQNQYEENIPEINDIENNIETMKEYKRSQIELEKRKKKLELQLKEQKFSSVLTMFKEQIDVQNNVIKNLENKLSQKNIQKNIHKNTQINEEILRNIIQTQKQNKINIELCKKQIEKNQLELKVNSNYIDELAVKHKEEYKEIRNLIDLETEIQENENKMTELHLKGSIHETNLIKIEEYKKYIEELTRFLEWKTKISELTQQEQKNRQRYTASILLKDKILQAESIAVINIINSINIHAQEYLDLFFPTDPIVIRLLPFKQTKKSTKPQINIEIDYKGMEADLAMLSGGELSRVVLAFTLALSEIFNSPLILLDECTSSLDQELSTIVMDGIRKNFENKLVIIIAHQVVSGNFDRQICL